MSQSVKVIPEMVLGKLVDMLGRPLSPMEVEVAMITLLTNNAIETVIQEEMQKADNSGIILP